ncbi:MAG: UvrD-helicase domain-containing protein [Promethearchaeota archaeon]
MIIDNYFKNIDYHFPRGRGIAVYNTDENLFNSFLKKLENSTKCPFKIAISDVTDSGSLPSVDIEEFDSCIIFQNKNIDEFSKIIDEFINSLVFPFYYHRKPIFIFSTIDKTEYSSSIQSGLLHTNYNKIVNLLLIEQLDSIVQNNNYLFTSHEFLNQETYSHIFTPIEQIMNDAMIDKNITFEPQLRIGRFLVDFLVEIGNKKIIVECDGIDFHNPFHDKERDKELKLKGYHIIHFTGSEIYINIESCIEKIQNTVTRNRNQSFVIDNNLDQSQKKALNHLTGPIRVLAPAGSGKTKTLINRIVNLINNGIDPNKILALAFNKKAAEEMNTRLNNKNITTSNKLNKDGVKVRTFHSFGNEIIRDHLHWQFPGGNLERSRTRQILKDSIDPFYQIPFRRNRDPLDVFLDALRKTKMELPHIDEVTVEDNGNVVPFGNIFNRYLELQTQHNFFNFDDMIYLALRAIIDDNILRKNLQNQFEYILVDEFQDLNKAQILLIQILALPQNNLFIVGDDDQMIYGWRGAEITHILDFNKRYAESEDCTLSTNYRSNKRIVNHSRWLIDHNLERVEKDIHPKPDKPSGLFEIKLSQSLWHQAVEINDWILTNKQDQNAKWEDFAVLFRYNTFQFIIAMILDSAQIPHTPVDDRRLFKENVGKDIYSYLRLILFPEQCSGEDFSRILKRPNRSLSNGIINQITSWRSFNNSPNITGLEQWQVNKLQNVVQKVQIIRQQIPGQIKSSQQLVSTISNEFGLKEFYQDQTKQNIDLDDAGDDVLLEVIIEVAKNKPKIEDFFTHVSCSISDQGGQFDPEDESQRDKVTLSTIHKTKGNEYSNVAYFNLDANERITEQSDFEEERRVTYVGVTRAIKNILITAPENGYSRFLNELAFNPDFTNLSEVKLNNLLSHKRRDEGITQNRIKNIENRINTIFEKFPELKGKKYDIPNGILKNAKTWLRQKLINRASNKIDSLENVKSNIIESKLFPVQDMIEKIEIEKSHRFILNNE